jgi:hypothetical protein
MIKQRQISKIIPFVRDKDGEYRAECGGIKFHVLWATKSGHPDSAKTWAFSAYDQNGNDLRAKPWLTWGTQKWAVAQCEAILAKQEERA